MLSVQENKMFAVRYLGVADLEGIREHLTSLSMEDRDNRFHAYMDDQAIAGYVNHIDFSRMILVGAFDRSGAMVGLAEAHLDQADMPICAEIGVTVSAGQRRQGLGRDLVCQAQSAARARGAVRADFYFQLGNRAIAGLAASLEGHMSLGRGYSVVSLPVADKVHHDNVQAQLAA